MKLLAIVALFGVLALMAWCSLKMNRLTALVEKLEESWKPMDEAPKKEDEA